MTETPQLSYADYFNHPLKRGMVRTIERLSGQPYLQKLYETYRADLGHEPFFAAAIKLLNLDVEFNSMRLAEIPATGPLVIVANHPHGMVDGMVMADLIEAQRKDYKLLTRSVLTAIHEDAGLCMISVPFPHQPDAQEKMIEMRRETMAHLRGCPSWQCLRGLGRRGRCAWGCTMRRDSRRGPHPA